MDELEVVKLVYRALEEWSLIESYPFLFTNHDALNSRKTEDRRSEDRCLVSQCLIFVARVYLSMLALKDDRPEDSLVAKVKACLDVIETSIRIDVGNGNTLWQDSVCVEMKTVRPAFEIHEGAIRDLIGYQKITCHFVFDVKLGENFRRKARYVAGGHMTKTPTTLTYSSVVSRDSVRIALTVAALNDLDILVCDIEGAYLTAK
jgi:hypothetical protein